MVKLETRRREFAFGDHIIKIACRSTPNSNADDTLVTDVPEPTDEIFLPNDEVQGSVDQVGWDIWESATDLLCNFLVQHPHLVQNHHVIELGGGVGVVSILAAKLNATKVVCTDYDTVVLDMASLNAELNNVSHICYVKIFDWDCRDLPFSLVGDGSSTILLGSDLMYSSACATKLRKAIVQILSQQPAAVMLLSHEIRHSVTWGRDEFGERQPVVESVDSVLESFLNGCHPLPPNPSDTVTKDECREPQLYACLLPFVPPGRSFAGEDDVGSSRADGARREMCSAAEVENMTLNLMRAAMDKGILSCPSDASAGAEGVFHGIPCVSAQATTPEGEMAACSIEPRVQVDTSRSGETLLLAFALDPHRLAALCRSAAAQAGGQSNPESSRPGLIPSGSGDGGPRGILSPCLVAGSQ